MSEREEALRRAQETMRRLQHEVRTPISQIMGYAELLEEELEERDAAELIPDLGKIRKAAERLLDLVDGKLRTEEYAGAPPLPEALATEGEPDVPDRGEETPEAPGAARILVVDGDGDDRELLARRLARQGFEVETARDGIEALRRIDTEEFDLALLEVLTSGMSGLEVLERVRRTRSQSQLPVILATSLDASRDTVEGLERGANDYVTKPFDFPVVIARVRNQLQIHSAARQVEALSRQLEFRSAFIRQALGRDVADDLLVEMAERPGALDLGGERRAALAVVADVRGSRARAASLGAAEHAAVLGNVLGGLCEVVAHYDGLVDAVEGDSVLALFGLPLPRHDDAERAVACAVAMQLEMQEINARSQREQLPAVEIGVGVAAGEVIVVGFGTGEQLRYKAIGEPLARAPWIEAAAAGGEVWIDPAAHEALGAHGHCDTAREVALGPEGVGQRLHRAVGVSGTHLISLRADAVGQGQRAGGKA